MGVTVFITPALFHGHGQFRMQDCRPLLCGCFCYGRKQCSGRCMQPITMMRNALGRNEGGSGVPLDKAAYEASVAYWAERAAVVAGSQPSGE